MICSRSSYAFFRASLSAATSSSKLAFSSSACRSSAVYSPWRVCRASSSSSSSYTRCPSFRQSGLVGLAHLVDLLVRQDDVLLLCGVVHLDAAQCLRQPLGRLALCGLELSYAVSRDDELLLALV